MMEPLVRVYMSTGNGSVRLFTNGQCSWFPVYIYSSSHYISFYWWWWTM